MIGEWTLSSKMAEAHQAVAFSFAITHEGFDINYDQEVLNLVWNSGIRSWKKRLARARVRLVKNSNLFFSHNNKRKVFPPTFPLIDKRNYLLMKTVCMLYLCSRLFIEWHPKWSLSGTHSKFMANHCHSSWAPLWWITSTFQ